MKRLSILLFLISILIVSCQIQPPQIQQEIISHTYYDLQYSEENEQALYVSYTLTKENLVGNAERKNNFKPDPKISTQSAQLSDYAGSGYDRGHLCPAAAMTQNQLAMDETFYMSNMSPQIASFNRGAWKKLESQVRSWVYAEDTLQVVTGPIFQDNIDTIGENRVVVPGYYYKVIYTPREKQMIAFILPNKKIEDISFADYMVTVDAVEQCTGLDFFSDLSDDIENRLESTIIAWVFD